MQEPEGPVLRAYSWPALFPPPSFAWPQQPCFQALPMELAFVLFFELHQQALPGTEGCTVFCCYGLRAAGSLVEVPTGPRGHAQKGLGS